jgi:polysaccharide biosynthesis/export protein
MKLSAIVPILLSIMIPGLSAQENVRSSSPEHLLADSAAAPSQPNLLHDRAPRYQMREGDSFELQFAFAPEFNETVTVQPDGYITLKEVGTIFVEGLTIPEMSKRIERAYSGILYDPQITISLQDFDKPSFVVIGQVGKPGKYELRSDLTVTKGIAIAGGFTDASKHSEVVLFRPEANGMTEARVIDTKKMLNSRNLSEDIHLSPGDIIYIPKNRISKISKYLPTANLGLYAIP